MGGNMVSLAPEMTLYLSAASSGYAGTMQVEVKEDTPIREWRVPGENHPDAMQSAAELAMDKNEDGPEDDEDDEKDDEDDWDEDMQPEAMPHGLLSR